MIHEQRLVDRLSQLPTERFSGEVFRATGISVDPTAASINGGRWSLPPDSDQGTYVLFTSLEQNGALAELCSFLATLTPIPRARSIRVTKISVTTSKTVRLSKAELTQLDVDLERYGQRDYTRTQSIGAALAFLEFDGLIAPSARWSCDNLIIFMGNHALTERLEIVDSEEVEWRSWAQANGVLGSS